MDLKERIVFFVFFLFLCVHLTTELVSASTATKETKETYFKVHRRRSIQEQRHGKDDVCSDIIGPKRENEIKQQQSPCPNLTVWVPKKTGFTEFVDVNEQGELKGGFSIAVFCSALRQLPFEVQPIFKPFINEKKESNGSYDQLVQHIEGKTCEAVAGDITIQGNRAQYADFTIPYMSSEVYMLVPAAQDWNQSLLTLLRPFTWRLWFMIIGACIFIGVAIGILEYRVGNPEFVAPLHQKLVKVIWFPISTFFFREGRILNKCSKIVLVIWLCMIFIVVQIFTACLSSWLTINQLHPKLPTYVGNIGYQNGSFISDFATEQCHLSRDKLRSFSSVDQYKSALDNGTVAAIYDELPFIDLFLAKYGDNYMKFGPLAQEPGLAFAFPLGSPLWQEFSRAVINVTESQNMTNMKNKYLGISSPDKSQPADTLPQSLDVHSFVVLFIFMGTVTIMAIIWSEISLMRKQAQILPAISIHNTSPAQIISANLSQLVEISAC